MEAFASVRLVSPMSFPLCPCAVYMCPESIPAWLPHLGLFSASFCLIAIDEAHCVVKWCVLLPLHDAPDIIARGSTFRPQYTQAVTRLLRVLSSTPVMVRWSLKANEMIVGTLAGPDGHSSPDAGGKNLPGSVPSQPGCCPLLAGSAQHRILRLHPPQLGGA